MDKEFLTDCGGIQPQSITERVFILDKSGSMAGAEKDTIGGFNAMIENQKQFNGKVCVSTILFSNFSEVLHDRKDLEEIKPLTQNDYCVGGCTALLDAIGDVINHISVIHKYIRKEDMPQKTIFIITTDGCENASRKYNVAQIKKMIKSKEDRGWQFLFVADNIDAVETAESLGINKEHAANYDAVDARMFFEEISESIHEFRETGCIPKTWAKKINKNKKD